MIALKNSFSLLFFNEGFLKLLCVVAAVSLVLIVPIRNFLQLRRREMVNLRIQDGYNYVCS